MSKNQVPTMTSKLALKTDWKLELRSKNTLWHKPWTIFWGDEANRVVGSKILFPQKLINLSRLTVGTPECLTFLDWCGVFFKSNFSFLSLSIEMRRRWEKLHNTHEARQAQGRIITTCQSILTAQSRVRTRLSSGNREQTKSLSRFLQVQN